MRASEAWSVHDMWCPNPKEMLDEVSKPSVYVVAKSIGVAGYPAGAGAANAGTVHVKMVKQYT